MLLAYSTKAAKQSGYTLSRHTHWKQNGCTLLGILYEKFRTWTLPRITLGFGSVRSHFSFNMIQQQAPGKILNALF